jgi:LmbE family N-acetylglucosaminyl deacetylase
VNILFLIAHPDDEAYGPYGTIAKLAKDHKVTVFCVCDGKRPGNTAVSSERIFAFKANCEQLGVEWKIQNNSDLSLEYADTVANVSGIIEHYSPDVVYTHNITDLNMDHRLLAEACLVACRPKPECTVKELYYFELPNFATTPSTFTPNTYVDISDFIESKKLALSRYHTETYDFPDARSIKAVKVLARYRGYAVGIEYAEAFQLVFAHDRKTR